MTLGRFGAWCSIASSYVVEVLGSCGFDWICIDLQHGFAGRREPRADGAGRGHHADPGAGPGAAPGRRDDRTGPGRGAAGVVVPMVNSAAQAQAAVAACRYPPDGIRSWGPARLMLGDAEYSARRANDRVHCLVMVETLDAVRNLDEIVRP